MKKNLKQLTMLAAFSCLPWLANAQSVGDEFKTTDKIMVEAIEDFDNKRYDEAIEKYKSISKNDTNYVLSIYELCLTYNSKKEYDKAIEAAKFGIRLKSKYDRIFYTQIGTSFDEKGNSDSSLYYYSKAIELFPGYHKLFFEAGITCSKGKKDTIALRYFTQSLKTNPFHAGTHLALGELAARNNNSAAALMAYTTFLLLENNTERSMNALINLEKVCNNEFPLADKKTALTPNLSGYDEIIQSRAAQTAGYKTKVKLNYFNVIKQLQVLCEKLKAEGGEKDIYNTFYVPLFVQIWKQDDFEGMCYSIFSGLNSDEVKEQVKKNDSKIKKMNDDCYKYFNEFRQAIPYSEGKKVYPGKRWFYDNGTIEAVGDVDAVKNMPKGAWMYFYKQGQLSITGSYNDKGQKNGVWHYYYEDGFEKQSVTYKDGVENGEYKTFYTNGRMREQGNYLNGKLDGDVISYHPGGAMKYKATYKNDIRNGEEINYYASGGMKNKATYVNGKVNGKVYLYFDNGNLEEEMTYENDAITGPDKGYYQSGKVKQEGNFQSGKLQGEWKFYHENGAIYKTGMYKNDKQTGKWTEYWDNGKPSAEYEMKNGDIDGVYKQFDYYQGKPYLEAKYSGGWVKGYKYMDEKGTVLSQGEEKKSVLKWSGYTYRGVKETEGNFLDGQRDGKWTEYYASGAKEKEMEYSKGKLNGLYKRYYESGVLASEHMYKDDKPNGYYVYYHENGKKQKDGYTINGELAGPYKEYFSNGNVSEIAYYINDEQVGMVEYFDVKGRKKSEDLYVDELLKEHSICDTTGKKYETASVSYGNGPLTLHFQNGKIAKQFTYKYGYRDGLSTFYFANGQKDAEETTKNGNRNGAYNEWYQDGKKYTEGNYKDGLLDGEYKLYDSEGALAFKTTYVGGERQGKREWYYPSGKVSRSGNYRNDDCEGEFTYYAEDGSVQLKIKYEMGVIISYTYLGADGKFVADIPVKNATGLITGYYQNGKKSAELNYINGNRNGKYTIYGPNGVKTLEIEMKDENYNGSYTEWYANGKVREQGTYENDYINGVFKTYNDKGQLLRETTYVLGIKYGPEKQYDATTGKLVKTINYVDDQPF